jgi:hypothetical protein
MKKVFVKKSLSDLIHEQNRIIEKLIMIQSNGKENNFNEDLKLFLTELVSKKVDAYETHVEEKEAPVEEKEDFSFNESDELPFIPTNNAGDIKLTSLSVEKRELDTDSIDKLKQTIKESNLG